MPSGRISPVTLPNGVRTPTLPVGTEVTEIHTRINNTTAVTMPPSLRGIKFWTRDIRKTGESPLSLPEMVMFASIAMGGKNLVPGDSTRAWLRAHGNRRGLATLPSLIVVFPLDTQVPLEHNPANSSGHRGKLGRFADCGKRCNICPDGPCSASIRNARLADIGC